jgi:hypothetical protein
MSGRNEWKGEGVVTYRPAGDRAKPYVAGGPLERGSRRESLGRYATSAEAWHAVRCYTRISRPWRLAV